jgi:hypothetical protein
MMSTVVFQQTVVDAVCQSLFSSRAGHVVQGDGSGTFSIVGPTHRYCSWREKGRGELFSDWYVCRKEGKNVGKSVRNITK